MPAPMTETFTPLRVLHLNSQLTGGGTDDQCVKLALSLSQMGHSVWLAGPPDREFSKIALSLGLPFHATPPEGPFKLRFILNTAQFIRRERVQIVHGHHGSNIWPTILAAWFSGVRPRIVITRHMAKSPSSWPSRRLLLGLCDAVIAVSHFVGKVLRDGFDEPGSPEVERRSRPPLLGDHSKIHVIHGGIDTNRFRPANASALRAEWGLSPDHLAFAVAGSYDLPRGKGQREFLQAAARVHEKLPLARFLIVGRGTMADLLRADIQRLGLSGKAWLTPYGRDMPQVMNAINCLVHPQIGTEAFGLVLCEAFACGKPVIASALDGIPEAFAIGNYGCLVPPEDIDALAGALVAEAGRKSPGENWAMELHRRVDAEFSLAASARNVAKLYQTLLADRSNK